MPEIICILAICYAMFKMCSSRNYKFFAEEKDYLWSWMLTISLLSFEFYLALFLRIKQSTCAHVCLSNAL